MPSPTPAPSANGLVAVRRRRPADDAQDRIRPLRRRRRHERDEHQHEREAARGGRQEVPDSTRASRARGRRLPQQRRRLGLVGTGGGCGARFPQPRSCRVPTGTGRRARSPGSTGRSPASSPRSIRAVRISETCARFSRGADAWRRAMCPDAMCRAACNSRVGAQRSKHAGTIRIRREGRLVFCTMTRRRSPTG